MTATVRIEKIQMPTDAAPGIVWYEVVLASGEVPLYFAQGFARGAAGYDSFGLFWGWDGSTPIGAHAGAEPGNADHLREWTPDELAGLLLGCNFAIREGRPEEVYKGRYTACVLASPVKPPPDIVERGAAD